MAIRLRRLGSKVCGVGGPLAGVLLGWTERRAAVRPITNEPAALVGAGGRVGLTAGRNAIYLNKNHIRLPIQINEADRPSLKEVQLYIKDHRNAPWVRRTTGGSDAKAFTVHLLKDGEYGFTMVTR